MLLKLSSIEWSVLYEPWFIRITIVFVMTIVLHCISGFLIRRLTAFAAKSKGYWDDVFSYGAIKPLPVAIWLVGLAYMVRIYAKSHQLVETLGFVNDVRDAVLVLCTGWFFWRCIKEFRQQYLQAQASTENEFDQTTLEALIKLAHLCVLVLTSVSLMQALGISISGLLAAGGIGGIAIGFAAKDILANFFGGLTIYMDRPFAVGEWIRSPDKDIEGTVEMISWRHTRIRRFNRNPLYVPNAVFTSVAVENVSRMTNRRLKIVIGLRYEDIGKMAAIVDKVKTMLQQHQAVDQAQTIIVNFDAFNASSIDFLVNFYTITTEWVAFQEIKQDILLKIAEIITQHQAEIAFPTQTLYIANPSLQTAEGARLDTARLD